MNDGNVTLEVTISYDDFHTMLEISERRDFPAGFNDVITVAAAVSSITRLVCLAYREKEKNEQRKN